VSPGRLGDTTGARWGRDRDRTGPAEALKLSVSVVEPTSDIEPSTAELVRHACVAYIAHLEMLRLAESGRSLVDRPDSET
jgi:hypothetical protein